MTILDDFHAQLDSSPVYFFYVDNLEVLQDDYNFEICLRRLPLVRQLRIRNSQDKALKLVNSLLLSYVVSLYERTSSGWADLEFGRHRYGKPFFKNRPNYSYNLSDEDGVSSVCISFESSEPIGVDLANPKDIARFSITDLRDFYRTEFRDIFTDTEVTDLDGWFDGHPDDSERLRRLSHYWSLKESMSKYEGYGLHKGLQRYGFEEPRDPIPCQVVESSPFTTIANLHLEHLRNFESLNCTSFTLDNIVCSVISQHDRLRVVKVDLAAMVEYINRLQ